MINISTLLGSTFVFRFVPPKFPRILLKIECAGNVLLDYVNDCFHLKLCFKMLQFFIENFSYVCKLCNIHWASSSYSSCSYLLYSAWNFGKVG